MLEDQPRRFRARPRARRQADSRLLPGRSRHSAPAASAPAREQLAALQRVQRELDGPINGVRLNLHAANYNEPDVSGPGPSPSWRSSSRSAEFWRRRARRTSGVSCPAGGRPRGSACPRWSGPRRRPAAFSLVACLRRIAFAALWVMEFVGPPPSSFSFAQQSSPSCSPSSSLRASRCRADRKTRKRERPVRCMTPPNDERHTRFEALYRTSTTVMTIDTGLAHSAVWTLREASLLSVHTSNRPHRHAHPR